MGLAIFLAFDRTGLEDADRLPRVPTHRTALGIKMSTNTLSVRYVALPAVGFRPTAHKMPRISNNAVLGSGTAAASGSSPCS